MIIRKLSNHNATKPQSCYINKHHLTHGCFLRGIPGGTVLTVDVCRDDDRPPKHVRQQGAAWVSAGGAPALEPAHKQAAVQLHRLVLARHRARTGLVSHGLCQTLNDSECISFALLELLNELEYSLKLLENLKTSEYFGTSAAHSAVLKV